MADLDLKTERDKIQREIEALERSLGSNAAALNVDLSDSNEDSDDDLEEQLDGDYQKDDVMWEDGGSSAEMCLQMNLVYQAVIEEKLQELEVLIAQNKEQQEELMWELAGRKTQRAGATKPYPLNLAIGHFLKPYFKDKVSGVGPPANPEMRERSNHIVKAFKDLTGKKWRSSDTAELRKAIFSDTLQRMLQPKLLKVEYLQQKHDNSKSDIEKKMFMKQIHEAEREIDDINQLKEEELLGQTTDAHDWDKIANINFEGIYTSDRLCRIWQNNEHPHINKEVWSEEEIEKLKEIAKEHNYIDWQAIAEDLGSKRTAFQCLQTFQLNNKDFKRSEFTKEEDEMLTHFVQRMRVGEHIPYKKISYFMEGRDGLQLLHRWTKSLDPNLRRGPWSKEEDEMLLKAVAKHGEKDWYKIRSEVPGRSDVQCRERYLKGLHKDVKKGKWSQEEHEKLLELTAKYGIGHWAKMSRELQNRTASQCLSKWKNINGYFKRKRQTLRQLRQRRQIEQPKQPRPKRLPKAVKKNQEMDSEEEMSSGSSSSENSLHISSSSSESEDEAMELMDQFGENEISNLLQSVPDLDLWIPKKRNSGMQEKSLIVYYDSPPKPPRMKKRKKRVKSFQFNTILKGIAYPPSTDVVTETVEDYLKEAEKNGNEILLIREEDILKILRRNTRESERKQIQRLNQRQTKPLPNDSDRLLDPRTAFSQSAVTRLYRASVDRKLLCAVTQWVGNVLLPLSTSRGSRSRPRIQADEMNKKLSCVTITSTPIFTLLIQFFQIDAEGCLQMIRLRKVEESEFLKRVKSTARKSTRKIVNSDSMSPKSILVKSFNDQKSNLQTEISPPPQKRQNSAPKVPKVKSVMPTPKPKTVCELLREKRMQKLNAAKSVQRTAVMSRNILVPTQIVIQQPGNPAVQPQTMLLPVAPTTSETGPLPVRPFSPMPTSQVVTANNASPNRMSVVSDEPLRRLVSDSRGSVSLPQIAVPEKTGQGTSSGVPPAPQPLPCQVTLLPRAVFPAPNNSPLPITFLLTPQGLISIPIQALRCPNLTQQSGNQSPRIISMPSNTVATGSFVTVLSNSSISNAPSDTLSVSTKPLPDTTSSKICQSVATPSTVDCPQTSGTHLSVLPSCETSKEPSQILPPVTSHLNQDGTAVTSLVGSLPKVVVSILPAIVPTEVSKKASPALPTIASSLRHTDMDTTSSAVCSPVVAGPCLSMPSPLDASKMPSQTLPATRSSLTQEVTAINASVDSQPQLTGPCLPALTLSSMPKVACPILPAVTRSLTQVGTAALSPVVCLQKMTSHLLPIITPSKSSIMPTQMQPVDKSSLKQMQEGTLLASSVTSQPQLESTCLPKASLASGLPDKTTQLKLTPQKYPIVKIAKLLQTDLPKENTANMASNPQYNPVLKLLKTDLPKENLANVASNPQNNPVVRLLQTDLPKENLVNVASNPQYNPVAKLLQMDLPKENLANNPQCIPVVKLLKTDLPKENLANVTSDPQRNPVPNKSSVTTNSERNLLDVKLISLEEETSVKEWLLGKQGVEVSKQKRAIPYLPPSICTLKTFLRLLQEKKTLEENAFKLLPFSGNTEVSPQQMQATLSAVVEQRLKDNLAFQLIKQRFLSAFTIPGFLAVLPPNPASIEQEESDEDIEDLIVSDTKVVVGAHKGNDATTDGDSVDNTSGGATAMLAEQETELNCSAENSDSVDDTERIFTRRSVYCRPVT